MNEEEVSLLKRARWMCMKMLIQEIEKADNWLKIRLKAIQQERIEQAKAQKAA